MPIALRAEIVKICKVRRYNLSEIIINFEAEKSDMFFIVEGSAMLFKTPFAYQKFVDTKEKTKVEKQMKNQFA